MNVILETNNMIGSTDSKTTSQQYDRLDFLVATTEDSIDLDEDKEYTHSEIYNLVQDKKIYVLNSYTSTVVLILMKKQIKVKLIAIKYI